MTGLINILMEGSVEKPVSKVNGLESKLVGTIATADNENYQIHYLGQAHVLLQLLALDVADVLKLVGSKNNFELAQLLYLQGRLEQARDVMELVAEEQPKKAKWWLDEMAGSFPSKPLTEFKFG